MELDWLPSVVGLYIPSIESYKLFLLLFSPEAALLKVVLVSQPARSGAPAGIEFRNVVPLHSLTPQCFYQVIFL